MIKEVELRSKAYFVKEDNMQIARQEYFYGNEDTTNNENFIYSNVEDKTIYIIGFGVPFYVIWCREHLNMGEFMPKQIILRKCYTELIFMIRILLIEMAKEK
jgi:hypothetical protein